MLFSQFQPTTGEGLTREERLFLLTAVGTFCREHCPIATGEGKCPLVTWHESVHTGALEKVCACPPAEWTARLQVPRPAAN